MFSIAVLAYNGENDIARCLASICNQGLGKDDRITVLENGSTDGTARIVSDLQAQMPNLSLCRIPFADKANAWDVFVFRESLGIDAHYFVFMDQDVVMLPGSLDAMRRVLDDHPRTLATSALPYGGRTAAAWRQGILMRHGLPGNLYALRADTMERIRTEGWCLPVGLIGDDGFLMWLLRHRFDPHSNADKEAIIPAEGAGFEYESIPAVTLNGLRKLYRRQRSYALRDMQLKLLVDHLKDGQDRRPPRDMAELYPAAKPWTQLFGPYGQLRPLRMRQVLCLSSWWRSRTFPRRTAPAWFEG